MLFGKDIDSEENPICENHKLGDFEFSECTNVDYAKLKLFLLSILWRSNITKRPMFESVNLGPHADRIKAMLWENAPGEELEYPIIITSFIRADYDYRDLILKPRKIRSKDGINSYIFSIGSFQFHFYVNSTDHKLPNFINKMTIKLDNRIRIIHLKGGMENALLKKLAE